MRLRSLMGRVRSMRGTPPASGGVAGPTTILDLNWLTDPGILSMIGAPIENGFYVGTWPFATGGTATSALAIAAGADGGPVYDLTNGVGSDGTGNQALTLPSPVTIPAGEFRMYYRFKYSGSGALYFLSSAASGGEEGGASYYMYSEGSKLFAYVGGTLFVPGTFTAGDYTLFLCRDASNDLYTAWSGAASLQAAGSLAGSFQFSNMLAQSSDESSGGVLDYFSATGNYIQKIKIESGISSRDLVWEAANGGTL